MKHTMWLMVVFCTLQLAQAEHIGVYEHGTVVRMRMTECTLPHHGFITTMGGAPAQLPAEICPEYTLISERVVFVIVGRSSNQLIPLADVIDFRFRNNTLAVRLDDAKHESKFSIKEMILRAEWDLLQKHMEDQLSAPPRPTDSALALQTRE